jgi:uncharacterized protein with HEPN domain
MRDDVQRVRDIQAAAEAILDYVSGMTEDEFAEDPKTIDAAFFSVIVLGEAVNTLLADPSGQGRMQDAQIIADHPEIPWKDWVGMRNLVTHQYFRRDHRVVWRDIASGEVGRLATTCRGWLNSRSPPPPVP